MRFSFSLLAASALVLSAVGLGCAPAAAPASDLVTVTGIVMARGHEPFVRYVLETEEHNWYVLELDGVDTAGFGTPERIRASGTLSMKSWNGKPFTHLAVTSWERVAE